MLGSPLAAALTSALLDRDSPPFLPPRLNDLTSCLRSFWNQPSILCHFSAADRLHISSRCATQRKLRSAAIRIPKLNFSNPWMNNAQTFLDCFLYLTSLSLTFNSHFSTQAFLILFFQVNLEFYTSLPRWDFKCMYTHSIYSIQFNHFSPLLASMLRLWLRIH